MNHNRSDAADGRMGLLVKAEQLKIYYFHGSYTQTFLNFINVVLLNWSTIVWRNAN